MQLFINIGESIPNREQLERLASIHRKEQLTSVGSEVELLSFLDSCKLSLSVSQFSQGHELVAFGH